MQWYRHIFKVQKSSKSGLILFCTELTLYCTELPENYNYLNQSELGNFSMHIIIGEMYSEMKMVDENHRAIGFQSRRTQMSGSPNNDALTENYNYKAGKKW